MGLQHDEFLEILVKAVSSGKEIVLETRVFEGVTERRREDGYVPSQTGAYLEVKSISPQGKLFYQFPLLSDSPQAMNKEADERWQSIQQELGRYGYIVKDKKLVKAESSCECDSKREHNS